MHFASEFRNLTDEAFLRDLLCYWFPGRCSPEWKPSGKYRDRIPPPETGSGKYRDRIQPPETDSTKKSTQPLDDGGGDV